MVGEARRLGMVEVDVETKSGWENYLAEVPDLDLVQDALVKERVIRKVMRDTGEPRDIVIEMIEAMRSMGEEAVLDLMDGEPTTLHAALQRYVDELEEEDGRSSDPVELGPYAMSVVDKLSTLLIYPWPGEK